MKYENPSHWNYNGSVILFHRRHWIFEDWLGTVCVVGIQSRRHVDGTYRFPSSNGVAEVMWRNGGIYCWVWDLIFCKYNELSSESNVKRFCVLESSARFCSTGWLTVPKYPFFSFLFSRRSYEV